MDEPLSNLDAKLRTQLRTDLIELHHKLGSTFVYVTHDQVEAMSMGTHIVLMHQGKIMQQGTPYEIYHNPDNVFTAQFIGTPPMNILEMNRDFNIDSCPYLQAAYAGFRPEYVRLLRDGEKAEENGLRLTGTVITHEMLGTEILYKIDTAYGRIQAKIFDDREAVDGQVELYVPQDKIVYFDEQQQRLR